MDAYSSEEEETASRPPRRFIINVAATQYDVVKDVARLLHWKMSLKEEDENWDMCWIDTGMTPDRLMHMKPYQKINHFPGMYTLARKNTLANNLNNMKRLFPELYDFFPPTWILPHDGADFRAQFNEKRAKTFIVKPEASCQGRGIFLTRHYEAINPEERYVVQRYLHRPFLLDGLKFDLRIYVLVSGCDPLRVFIHEEGLARFATEPYAPPTKNNLSEMCMHLTNYAINKNSPNFVFNSSDTADDIGHKKSLTALLRILRERGHNTDALWEEIKQIVLKTLICAQPMLSQIYRACQPYDPANGMCFEILGFDIFLDHKLKPWLLEVNHSPSFTTDTPLDHTIKQRVILDAISLLGTSADNREKYFNQVKVQIQQRASKGRNFNALRHERQNLHYQAVEERDRWEAEHCGGFTKIFPNRDPVADELLEGSMKLWTEQTGGKPKARMPEVKIEKPPRPRAVVCKPKLEPAQEEPSPRKPRLLRKPSLERTEMPHYMAQTASQSRLLLMEEQRKKVVTRAARVVLQSTTGEFLKPKVLEFAQWERQWSPR
jgi:tubulin polyglutamylase TTLL6/13